MGEVEPNSNPIKRLIADFSFIRGNFLIILMDWLYIKEPEKTSE